MSSENNRLIGQHESVLAFGALAGVVAKTATAPLDRLTKLRQTGAVRHLQLHEVRKVSLSIAPRAKPIFISPDSLQMFRLGLPKYHCLGGCNWFLEG
jgi:hypothetical protein